ncbi:hypothetical protein MSAN_02242100 [Mycena sanguinolenta]|uniref:Uncharacterized protein n=1 Tax=Mycena sanguinolenta TaxID=230812 RepID=A0A8H6XBR1_9AGAR|nr:hypothetical protein MSAN_02242100 [Mycena sanguinolenta]
MPAPSLPLELQREIFEIAVISSQSQDAALKLNLSLVAHRVHFWVDRVFYEVVTISGQKSADGFLKLVDLKPPGFFADVVKTLLLFDPAGKVPSPFPAARILSVCGRVQSLAWWSGEMTPLALSSAGQFPLRRLSTHIENLANIIALPAPSGWLSAITHLTLILGVFRGSRAPELKILKHLPRLTHVALFAVQADPSHVHLVSDSCPHLQVLVMTPVGHSVRTALTEQFADSRVVVVMPFTSKPLEDWEAAHFGLPDMWTRAHDVLAERKSLLAALLKDD